MTATFLPASVRKNRRSFAAVKIVMPDPEGGAPYEHKVYFRWREFSTGAEARKNAAEWIASDDFDRQYFVDELKAAWGLT